MPTDRILIVEDEKAVARGLEYALQVEGFEVLYAGNGQSALNLARTQHPQMILLDLRLPDISGFDVCRQLRQDGLRQPILMLTALDDPIDKVLGLELGADDYVVKAYNLRELIARIRSLLRRAYGELSESSAGQVFEFGEIQLDLDQLQVTRAKSSRISLELQEPDPPITLWCDSTRMELVVSNLLDNALKFTPPGGEIVIGGEQIPGLKMLWVRDNGIGIAPDELPRIFDRFYRGRQPAEEGSGLGLAIAKSLVEAQNGHFSVQSTLGKGSKFVLEFPGMD